VNALAAGASGHSRVMTKLRTTWILAGDLPIHNDMPDGSA